MIDTFVCFISIPRLELFHYDIVITCVGNDGPHAVRIFNTVRPGGCLPYRVCEAH